MGLGNDFLFESLRLSEIANDILLGMRIHFMHLEGSNLSGFSFCFLISQLEGRHSISLITAVVFICHELCWDLDASVQSRGEWDAGVQQSALVSGCLLGMGVCKRVQLLQGTSRPYSLIWECPIHSVLLLANKYFVLEHLIPLYKLQGSSVKKKGSA